MKTAALVLMVVLGSIFAYFFSKEDEKSVPLPAYQPSAADSTAGEAVNGEILSGETQSGVAQKGVTKPDSSRPMTIQVDVKGAVKSPGVYELPAGSRVHEAIDLAGGLTPDADTLRINLAAFLNDGQVLYVPKKGEEEPVWETGESSSQTDGSGPKININTATLEELDSLPGIGPSKAQAILQYREEHGPFTDVKQLGEVSGIGEKTLEKLLPYITVK